MNITQAIQKLIEGNKINRTCWQKGHFWQLVDNQLVDSAGDRPNINKNQLLSEDWEVNEENKGHPTLGEVKMVLDYIGGLFKIK